VRVADLTRRLARLRVPLGFVSAAVVVWLAAPTPMLLAWGSAVAALGEGLRLWAAGHLNKSREVTSSGPYRYFAHPLYVGSATMGVGLAIASGSVLVGVLIAIYLATTITAAIRSEEAYLREKFGTEYEAYRRGASASAEKTTPRRPFSLAQAMANREYRSVAGLLAAVLLLLLKATL
jgi:protein-S-isoprenylcysteine O-methyltransferase Ste14